MDERRRTARLILAAATMTLLGACGGGSTLLSSAEEAAARRGLTFTAQAEVDGVHERALCGTAGGQQAIYREDADRLMLQGEFEPEIWAALHRNWRAEAP